MRKQYQETFAQVRASGRLRTEVMNMTEQERSGGRRRFPKAALIAAALVLALAGTAVGAELLGLTVNFVTGSSWCENESPSTGYEILVDRALMPAGRLSAEALELAASTGDGVCYLDFPTLEEGRSFWGLELPGNPMLNIPQMMKVQTSSGTYTGECVLRMSCQGGALMWSDLETHYSVPRYSQRPVTVWLTASIVTENAANLDYENARNVGRYFNAEPDGVVQSYEEYVTPSGLEAVIVTSHVITQIEPEAEAKASEEAAQVARELRCTSAFFVRDDILYELTVNDFAFDVGEDACFRYKEEDALEILKEILDAYE